MKTNECLIQKTCMNSDFIQGLLTLNRHIAPDDEFTTDTDENGATTRIAVKNVEFHECNRPHTRICVVGRIAFWILYKKKCVSFWTISFV